MSTINIVATVITFFSNENYFLIFVYVSDPDNVLVSDFESCKGRGRFSDDVDPVNELEVTNRALRYCDMGGKVDFTLQSGTAIRAESLHVVPGAGNLDSRYSVCLRF